MKFNIDETHLYNAVANFIMSLTLRIRLVVLSDFFSYFVLSRFEIMIIPRV